jgi:hypothetical protein
MQNKPKFKVGDTVVRSAYSNYFPYGNSPVKVIGVTADGEIEVDTDNGYWSSDFFELYQLEQSEVKPMQPLVSIYDKALDLRFNHHDLGDVSLREFYCNLLLKLWEDPYGFSGKKPYGNSGWDEPVYAALIKAGVMSGEFDSEGYIKRCDFDEGSEFVSKMIAHAFGCNFSKDA